MNMLEIALDHDQKDALQEVANIGAAHAATALSQMINKEIEMGIAKVDVVSLGRTIDCVKDQEIVVGVFLKVEKGIPLNIMLLLSQESAFSLADMLMGRESGKIKNDISEMDKSAIQELANVIMCSFFDSLTELLQVSLIPGPPVLAYDMPAAIMDYVLIQLGELSNEAVVFSCYIKEEKHESFKIDLFLLPEPSSVKIILEKLGMV
jgi:chemotaxis protein CheC